MGTRRHWQAYCLLHVRITTIRRLQLHTGGGTYYGHCLQAQSGARYEQLPNESREKAGVVFIL